MIPVYLRSTYVGIGTVTEIIKVISIGFHHMFHFYLHVAFLCLRTCLCPNLVNYGFFVAVGRYSIDSLIGPSDNRTLQCTLARYGNKIRLAHPHRTLYSGPDLCTQGTLYKARKPLALCVSVFRTC